MFKNLLFCIFSLLFNILFIISKLKLDSEGNIYEANTML